MIRTPNPGRAIISIFHLVFSVALLHTTIGMASALEPKQIEITIPEKIIVDEEISIQIRLLSPDEKVLKKDSRVLKIDIVNNDIPESKEIQLKNGQAKVSHKFKKRGATLMTTYDPANKHLVNYSGFTVHDQKEGK